MQQNKIWPEVTCPGGEQLSLSSSCHPAELSCGECCASLALGRLEHCAGSVRIRARCPNKLRVVLGHEAVTLPGHCLPGTASHVQVEKPKAQAQNT